MAGFRKAKAEQAAIKMGLYGSSGSGKTLTALMCSEGLVKGTKKRIAYVDTECGTHFYCQDVKERKIHPEKIDFDVMTTRSIVEVSNAVKALNADEYGVVVIDSITHLWEAAQAAYSGKETRAGTIPFHAWAKIKKPYKDLIAFLLNSPLHVFICGRQANVFEENEDTGEMKKVGVKMKAEGETAYEPHILIHMENVRNTDGSATITAFAEKDRTGILSGKIIKNPTFETLIKPIIPLLGGKQAQMESADDTARRDAEAIAAEDARIANESLGLLRTMSAKIQLASTAEELSAIGKEITADMKKRMTTDNVASLREVYQERESQLKGGAA